MRYAIAMIAFILLISIHALDMELTRHYIGDRWELETFLPMSLTIKELGIHKAVWASRIIMYILFFIFLETNRKPSIQNAMIVGTLLYWTSMIPWLFTLHILAMP